MDLPIREQNRDGGIEGDAKFCIDALNIMRWMFCGKLIHFVRTQKLHA